MRELDNIEYTNTLCDMCKNQDECKTKCVGSMYVEHLKAEISWLRLKGDLTTANSVENGETVTYQGYGPTKELERNHAICGHEN